MLRLHEVENNKSFKLTVFKKEPCDNNDLTEKEKEILKYIKNDDLSNQSNDVKDTDWIDLKVEVMQAKQHFETTRLSLEVRDIIRLYDWFKCLSENRLPDSSILSFTEPYIRFFYYEKRDNQIKIIVNLWGRLKPDFMPILESEYHFIKDGFNSDDWPILFKLKFDELNRISDDLLRIVADYKKEIK